VLSIANAQEDNAKEASAGAKDQELLEIVEMMMVDHEQLSKSLSREEMAKLEEQKALLANEGSGDTAGGVGARGGRGGSGEDGQSQIAARVRRVTWRTGAAAKEEQNVHHHVVDPFYIIDLLLRASRRPIHDVHSRKSDDASKWRAVRIPSRYSAIFASFASVGRLRS
jgi:hypothetical protein